MYDDVFSESVREYGPVGGVRAAGRRSRCSRARCRARSPPARRPGSRTATPTGSPAWAASRPCPSRPRSPRKARRTCNATRHFLAGLLAKATRNSIGPDIVPRGTPYLNISVTVLFCKFGINAINKIIVVYYLTVVHI